MARGLITGGNKGIGLEITRVLLENGYDIVVLARAFSKFTLPGKNIQIVKFDLRNISDIPNLVKKIGHVDLLINNAGMLNSVAYDKYPESKKHDLLAINIEAPVALIREFSVSMLKQGNGKIINIASVAGEIGHPDIWYGVSKA